MAYPFELKKVYNFDIYPAILLGNDFQNVTIMAVMDFESANQLADLSARHVNVYPHLPPGTPDDPSMYDYVKVKMPSGENTILGIPWINLDTLTLVQSLTIVATIDGVSGADVERVRVALVQNGYNNIDVKLIGA